MGAEVVLKGWGKCDDIKLSSTDALLVRPDLTIIYMYPVLFGVYTIVRMVGLQWKFVCSNFVQSAIGYIHACEYCGFNYMSRFPEIIKIVWLYCVLATYSLNKGFWQLVILIIPIYGVQSRTS